MQLEKAVSVPKAFILPAMHTVETHFDDGTMVVQLVLTESLPRLL